MHRPTSYTFALLSLIMFIAALIIAPVAAASPSNTVNSIEIQGIQDGEIITGGVVIEAVVSGDSIARVEFAIEGASRVTWTEGHAPFIFRGDENGVLNVWDTTQVPDGAYTLTATAFDTAGGTAAASVSFSVANVAMKQNQAAPATAEEAGMAESLPETASAQLAVPTTCEGTSLKPGMNLQGALDAGGIGAKFCFQPGTYRLTTALRPKESQTLQGLPGAVLNGSRSLTTWQRSDSAWVTYGMLPTQTPTLKGTCMPNYSGCRYPHDLFFDNKPLYRVTSLSSLQPGRFYADYANNAVYIADDPTNHRVELARASAAIVGQAKGIVIRGLTVEKFAPVSQDGAIFLGGADSIVEQTEARLNHAAGIKGLGTRIIIRNNYAHHNGQLGVSGTQLVDGLFEGNELAYNNYAGFYNFDGETGGGKWTKSQVTVRNSYSHHNKGVGLWFDVDSKGILVEGNRSIENESDGIRLEISYDAVVRNNTITGNAFVVAKQRNNTSIWTGGGIVVHTVTNIEITGNYIDNNLNGIELRKSDRGSGLHGLRDLRDARVHHNQIRMQQGATGLVYHDDPTVYTSKNNRFYDNNYGLVSDRQFVWKNDTITYSKWKEYGNDQSGTFDRLP